MNRLKATQWITLILMGTVLLGGCGDSDGESGSNVSPKGTSPFEGYWTGSYSADPIDPPPNQPADAPDPPPPGDYGTFEATVDAVGRATVTVTSELYPTNINIDLPATVNVDGKMIFAYSGKADVQTKKSSNANPINNVNVTWTWTASLSNSSLSGTWTNNRNKNARVGPQGNKETVNQQRTGTIDGTRQ